MLQLTQNELTSADISLPPSQVHGTYQTSVVISITMGMYPVFAANTTTCAMVISVVNAPYRSISWKEYQGYTEADLPELAHINHQVGWTVPKVRKMEINGIPALVFNHRRNKEYMLSINLWIDGSIS